jgi:hypothetical protein
MKATVVRVGAAAGTLLVAALSYADPFCGVPHNPCFPPFSGEVPRFVGPGCKVPPLKGGPGGQQGYGMGAGPGGMQGPGGMGAGPGGMQGPGGMGAGPGGYPGPGGMGYGPGGPGGMPFPPGYGFGPGPYPGAMYPNPYQGGAVGQMPGMPQQPQMPQMPQLPWQPMMPRSPELPHAGFQPSYPMYGWNNQSPEGPLAFPHHPYMRSPRDFFMWREGMEDQLKRETRPVLVP